MDLGFLLSFLTDVQPGRLTESLIFLGVLWWKFNPHLKKMEDRLDGVVSELATMNAQMRKGFEEGETRFQMIESRLTKLEKE